MEKGKLKDALETGRGQRNLVVYVHQPDGNISEIRESNYVAESLKLSQKIMKKGSFALGGCLSSCFSLKVFDLDFELKNREIQVDFIVTVDEEVEIIHLFHGKITEVEKEKKTGVSTITAYDALGIAGDKQATVMPIILSGVFTGAMNDLSRISGIDVPGGDDISIKIESKHYIGFHYYTKPMTISEVLGGICELMGGFGIIDGGGVFRLIEVCVRSGEFVKVVNTADTVVELYTDAENTKLKLTPGKAYTIMSNATSGQTSGYNGFVTVSLYDTLGDFIETVSGYTPFTFKAPVSPYPAARAMVTVYYSTSNWVDTWTWIEGEEKEAIGIVPMQNTQYEDYATDAITGVQYFVKNDETDTFETVLFGSDENPYTLTSGIFKANVYKEELAKYLYEKIKNMPQFTPASSMPSIGYPGIVNVGDIVNDGDITTIVLERTLTGIHGMDDVYASEVDKTMPVIEASEDTAY